MVRVITGDCLAVMPTLAARSVDAIVSDPPYGLAFMGKGWDHAVPGVEFWREALRVAKPGAHLAAFGGTRTYHRLAVAIEDAGWEIRDCLSWLYGSGFPKSLDVSKAVDRHMGAERAGRVVEDAGTSGSLSGPRRNVVSPGLATTEEARAWEGWGTALKPAWEPIILARKPLAGTVAANVLQHGTGALNIDGCRVVGPKGDGVWGSSNATVDRERKFNASPGMSDYRSEAVRSGDGQVGRWPANVVLDEAAAAQLDQQAPDTGGCAPASGPSLRGATSASAAYGARLGLDGDPAFHGDRGGASRFFYTAKAGKAERNAGLEHLPPRITNTDTPPDAKGANSPRAGAIRSGAAANHHPTVKPLDLMQWLCRLVTPKGGVILDPFCGSGTTGRAAIAEGFQFIGIELDPDYTEIARARIRDYAPLFGEVAS